MINMINNMINKKESIMTTAIPFVVLGLVLAPVIQPVDWTSLPSILLWIVTGGGAGTIAFFLWELAEKTWPNLAGIKAFWERAITLSLTGLLALGGYGLQILFLQRPPPTTWMQFIEEGVSIVALAIITALTIHGAKQSRTP